MAVNRLHSEHDRQFETNRFVYPVLSRRSGGLSIGINVNPDKLCNFSCVYCQVDRGSITGPRQVDVPQLLDELDRMLEQVTSGTIFTVGKFRETPPALRHLTDIAFSGDGEPTAYKRLDELVVACARLKASHGVPDLPLVLITNASLFHRDHVRRALEALDAHQGVIWAKLDAGTQEYFAQVNRASFPLERIVRNITDAARARPLVIQSLFARVDGQPPSDAEMAAYCGRLCGIVRAGGQIAAVQVHTVARTPAEEYVSALTSDEVDMLAALVRRETGLHVATFHTDRTAAG